MSQPPNPASFAPYKPSPDDHQSGRNTSDTAASKTSPPSIASTNTESSPSQHQTWISSQNRSILDDEPDPRYATEGYQQQSGITSTVNQHQKKSSSQVVFDADSPYDEHSASHSAVPGAVPPIRSLGSSSHHGAPGLSQQPPYTSSPYHQSAPPAFQRPDHASYTTSQGWSISSLCAAAWALPPFSSVLVLIWETENDLARFHAYQSGLAGSALILFVWFLRSWIGLRTIGLLAGMGGLGWFWVCASAASQAAPTLTRVPYLPYLAPLAERWVGEE